MKNILEEYKNINNEFYNVDEANRRLVMKLEFNSPVDIFDLTSLTKIPLLKDSFISQVTDALKITPRNHKINLDICFNDLGEYKEEELKKIFYKNTLLRAKKELGKTAEKNKIAIGLISIGVISLVSMILLMSLWKNGGIVKDVISYIFDIATTVTIWEAMTILIVENKEKRDLANNLLRKFDSISFHKKNK